MAPRKATQALWGACSTPTPLPTHPNHAGWPVVRSGQGPAAWGLLPAPAAPRWGWCPGPWEPGALGTGRAQWGMGGTPGHAKMLVLETAAGHHSPAMATTLSGSTAWPHSSMKTWEKNPGGKLADTSLEERWNEAVSASCPTWPSFLSYPSSSSFHRGGIPLLLPALLQPLPTESQRDCLHSLAARQPWVHLPRVLGTIPAPLTFLLSPVW